MKVLSEDSMEDILGKYMNSSQNYLPSSVASSYPRASGSLDPVRVSWPQALNLTLACIVGTVSRFCKSYFLSFI